MSKSLKECALENKAYMAKSIAGEPSDRHAFWYWVSFPLIKTITNADRDVYYSNHEEMLSAQLKAIEAMEGAIPVIPDFGTVAECTGFGCEVHFDPIGFMTVKPNGITELEDIKALTPADPWGDNYMRRTLEFLQYAKENVPEGVEIAAPIINAPFTAAAQCYGMADFCTNTLDETEVVEAWTDVMTETVIRFIAEIIKVLPDVDHIVLGDDTASFLAPAQYEEFVVPLYKRIMDAFPEMDFWLHNDGNNIHLAEITSQVGFKVWHVGRFNPIQEFAEKTAGHVSLCGDINPIEYGKMTPEEAYDVCIEKLKSFEGNTKIVLSTGGFLGMGTDEKLAYAMARAANDYAVK